MRGHSFADEALRTRAFEEHKQEIQGRLPKGPFEGENEPVKAEDSPVVRRFKLAVERDRRYALASAPYLQVFGLSQALRSIYDGGGQIQDGEANQ